jgi:hypothetical protein
MLLSWPTNIWTISSLGDKFILFMTRLEEPVQKLLKVHNFSPPKNANKGGWGAGGGEVKKQKLTKSLKERQLGFGERLKNREMGKRLKAKP